MLMQKCSKCKIEKPINDFYSQKDHKRGIMCLCKNCFNSLCVKRWIERKKKYVRLIGGKCEYCGIELTESNYSIFDFHHIDSNSKEYTWTKLKLFSDSRILKELSKCKLLCANCHRLEHSNNQ